MKVKELTAWLENKYPAKAAEHWDNVGLLVGDDEAEVSHIFLALDLTEETLEEAIQPVWARITSKYLRVLLITAARRMISGRVPTIINSLSLPLFLKDTLL